jgi:hypothetical protein
VTTASRHDDADAIHAERLDPDLDRQRLPLQPLPRIEAVFPDPSEPTWDVN